MALFKISKGLKANLPSAKTAGHCWYTIDDSLFYIDYEDENGVVQRKALNAKDAETLMGVSLDALQLKTLVVTADITTNTADYSASEIKSYIDAGGNVVCQCNGMILNYKSYIDLIGVAIFTQFDNGVDYVNTYLLRLFDDKTFEYLTLDYTPPETVYVGPDMPMDPNIKVWINTAEEGGGVVPVLPRISTISLPKASWSGSSAPYYQIVDINTVTPATKIELNPTVNQIVSLQNDDIALMAENDAGSVKVYSFGGKPSIDMTMQVTLTEVSYV